VSKVVLKSRVGQVAGGTLASGLISRNMAPDRVAVWLKGQRAKMGKTRR